MKTSSIVAAIAGFLVVIFLLFFVGCERIDTGNVGIKVNNTGGNKGVSKVEYVTGWQFYVKAASKIYEFPISQQHVEYDPFEVPAKGGTIFTVHPSFNYAVNPGEVANIFQQLRQTNRVLEKSYIFNALRIAIREATNTFTVDSVLNNIQLYDAEVKLRLDRQLHPWFSVSQFTSGLKPDEKLAGAILDKTLNLQKAIAIENNQRAIMAQAQNDIIGARRDSTVKITAAAAEAKGIQLMQEQLSKSPQYVELIKAQKWNGALPQYMLGNGTSMLMQIPK